MDVTDPQVVKFVNEQIRPNAERIRNTYYSMKIARSRWETLQALVPRDDSIIEDGREDEGASRITGLEVWQFMELTHGLASTFEENGEANLSFVNHLCHRPAHME